MCFSFSRNKTDDNDEEEEDDDGLNCPVLATNYT